MPSIKTKDIKRALNICKEKHFFENLNNIYKQVPNGKCSGCSNCCMESVNTYFVEFLNIINYLDENKKIYEEFLPRVVKYYFLEMVEKKHCPFLDNDKKCVIYDKRPLVCRSFGNISKVDHENAYKDVLENNKEISKYLNLNYGIQLPSSVINYKIDYCNDFKSDKVLTKHQRADMFDSMFFMESNFLMNEVIDENFIEIGLVSWFVYTLFDVNEINEMRIDVMREFLQYGESKKLDVIINKLFK